MLESGNRAIEGSRGHCPTKNWWGVFFTDWEQAGLHSKPSLGQDRKYYPTLNTRSVRSVSVKTYLVWVLCSVSVDEVVRRIELAFQEPSNVAVLKRARGDCREVLVPCQQFSREVAKELVWVFNRLFVEFSVVINAFDVGLRWVFAI